MLEDALREERLHGVERERRSCVEERERKARARRQRRQHVPTAERRGSLLRGLCGGCVDKPQEIPGLRDAGEKLLCELECLRESLVVGIDAKCIVLERMPGDRNGVGIVERSDTYELERALDSRACRDEHLGRGRGHLRDDGDRAGLDVGKERVEQPLRASRVLTREQGFLQLREDPDHALSSDRVDERLHPTFELSDVDRAGVDLRSGRLEHDRVLVDAIERCPCQRGLPHAVLADEEDGSRRALFERGDDDLDELSSTPCEERGRIVERSLPDPPDVLEVRQRAPGLGSSGGSRARDRPRSGR